jgi:hypothetical protein
MEAKSLERRRSQRLAVAEAVAEELGARWPEVSFWLFGSTLGPGFHADSDLDLAVAGMPAEALMEALALAEGSRCGSGIAWVGLLPPSIWCAWTPCRPPGGNGSSATANGCAERHDQRSSLTRTPA